MRWAQYLKRVFRIDIEAYNVSGGAMKVIACIESPPLIDCYSVPMFEFILSE